MKKKASSDVKKIGIYLPEERVTDVEKYRDRMNFSAMFWLAFDQEKHRLDCLPKGKKMSTIIERLRQSKQEHESTQIKEGRVAGTSWASDVAEFHELLALREFSETADRECSLEVNAGNIAGALENKDFWDEAIGDLKLPVTDAFAGGFMESALDVLDAAEAEGL